MRPSRMFAKQALTRRMPSYGITDHLRGGASLRRFDLLADVQDGHVKKGLVMGKKWAVTFVLAFAWIAGFAAPLRAADASPEEVLAAKGLTKSGALYLLENDINISAILRPVRETK